jgi:lysozyme
MIQGIDISHRDNPINWKKISPDIKFVFAKAAEGATYKDPMFDKYWQILKATTLIRGAYMFWNCTATPQQHIDNLLSLNIDFSKKGVLPLMLDIENQKTTELDKMVAQNACKYVGEISELLCLIKQHTGREAIVYSDPSYFKDYLNSASWPNSPLWLAAIQAEPPKPIKGYSKVTFWQNSWNGLINGELTGGNLDMNYFLGTLTDLQTLANF